MSITTVSGADMCAHGIAYSSEYTCMACDQALRDLSQTDFFGKPFAVAEQVWTRADVESLQRDTRRIVELLERIAGMRR